MKCLKCGFVSYAGLEKCKKCGYVFAKAATQAPAPVAATPPAQEARTIPRPPPEPPPAPPVNPLPVEVELPAPPEPSRQAPAARTAAIQLDLARAEDTADGGISHPWREELSNRVEKFRQRRARLQPEGENERNLELDFDEPDQPGPGKFETEKFEPDKIEDDPFLRGPVGTSQDQAPALELELGERAMSLGGENPLDETQATDAPEEWGRQSEGAPAEEEEAMSWGEPQAKEPPMEILVGAPAEPVAGEEAGGILVASLSRRFFAGLTDALVLMLGASVFGVIFWRFCGRLELLPMNVAVIVFIAGLIIFGYFVVFTALVSATPGLLWVGCEVRNLHGARPSKQEAFWRALGVLVSISAVMLGFVWACVDSERLTWHDRMSGTVIIEPQCATELARLNADLSEGA